MLRRHRAEQDAERPAVGPAWQQTGLAFTTEDGRALTPDSVTLALALALASGVHLKVVSEMLGDSTIAITADTYTSVLPEVAREAAEAAQTVPRAPRNTPGPIRR